MSIADSSVPEKPAGVFGRPPEASQSQPEGAAPGNPPEDGSRQDWALREATGTLPPDPEHETAVERERWLRQHIDREQELLLLVGRTVVGGLVREPTALRFWRWLIDDLRSERREQAALLTGQRDEGSLSRIWRWLRGRRRPAQTAP